jgi:tRNA pseudouridine38-40 synthase
MARYRLELEYFGAKYAGWQKQAGLPSIQQAVEDAIFALCQERAECYSAGRTDAGVHAICMAAHIDVAKKIPARNIVLGLNFHLQKAWHTIAVLDAKKAADDFHARFSCVRRHYIYRILNRPTPPQIEAGRVWWTHKKLDAKAMDRAAQLLVGKHDFSTFRAADCQAESPVKTLDSISVRRRGEHIEIRTSARSFLHHQVRNMAGTLALVGEGKWSEEDFARAFKACDRTKGGPTAPAEGLYFEKAEY